tara:strand:+ start:180 stop:527 length:348 start_codon:yes stop_codon:yes gene_type:complete
MKEKEHTYYYTDKRKTYSSQELGRFLRENNISPTEAVNIIKKYKLKENKGDSRTDWKMFRFTLYLWLRHKEELKHGQMEPNTLENLKMMNVMDKELKYRQMEQSTLENGNIYYKK